jgi:phenylalanyl-tRNA synthetase beta chain
VTVRRTAVRLGLRTVARARFEKSLDAETAPFTARRFARLLLDIVPTANVTSTLGDARAAATPPAPIRTSAVYINQRLGTELTADAIAAYLRRLEFGVHVEGDALQVTVPSFRATKDVSIPEDLVEEVGRIYGYDRIGPEQPRTTIPQPYRHPDRTLHRAIRTVLSFEEACTEIQSYSFDSEPFLRRIGQAPEGRLGVRNPISSEATHLRSRLIPSVLAALERSAPHADALRLYEIGRVFVPTAEGGALPRQPYRLALAIRSAAHHDEAAALQRGAFFELKGVLERLFARLGVALVSTRPTGALPPWLNPGRSAEVKEPGGRMLGYAGALHPAVVETLGIGMGVAAAEVDLEVLRDLPHAEPGYVPTPRYPPVPVDLSIIVPERVTHAELEQRIQGAHPDWVKNVTLVGAYRGSPIPGGQKSMTYRIQFQSAERTLSMDEVNIVVRSVVDRMAEDLGAWVRQ